MLFVMLALMLVALGRTTSPACSARAGPAHRAGASSAPASERSRGCSSDCPASFSARPIGALTFEYLRNPDARRALAAGAGGLLGFVLGVVAKAVFGFLLIGLALLAYVF